MEACGASVDGGSEREGVHMSLQPYRVNAGGTRCAGRPAAQSPFVYSEQGARGGHCQLPICTVSCQPGLGAKHPLFLVRLLENHFLGGGKYLCLDEALPWG